jgi:DnaD/phage-associated family protein
VPNSRPKDTPFAGYIDAMRDTVPVPARFFTDVLPEITSLGELRVTAFLFRLFALHGGAEAPVAEPVITGDRALRQTFRVDGTASADTREAILDALDRAVARGSLLRVVARSGRRSVAWYFLHTPVTRELVQAIQRGAIAPPQAMWVEDHAPEVTADPPTAFYLYEQNIGPLTPLVADRITRAMDAYPLPWIEDAIEEAVAYNRRSWRYIERILETWSQQGRPDRST